MNTVLITGGAGFIGSHAADRMIKEGYRVVVIDNLATGKRVNLSPEATFYETDIRDQAAVAAVFAAEKPSVLLHFAAQASVAVSTKSPALDAGVNVLGTLNLLEQAAASGVKHVVFASTGGAIYDPNAPQPYTETSEANPLSIYGISKLCAERYLHYFSRVHPDLRLTILRLANVYGPRQDSQGEAGVVSIFTDRMLSGQTPIIDGAGEQTRDFVYVGDVVEAFAGVVAVQLQGTFNVSTGRETSVNALFDALVEATGYAGERVYGEARPNDMPRSVLSSALLQQATGWRPRVEIGAGIARTVEWFRG